MRHPAGAQPGNRTFSPCLVALLWGLWVVLALPHPLAARGGNLAGEGGLAPEALAGPVAATFRLEAPPTASAGPGAFLPIPLEFTAAPGPAYCLHLSTDLPHGWSLLDPGARNEAALLLHPGRPLVHFMTVRIPPGTPPGSYPVVVHAGGTPLPAAPPAPGEGASPPRGGLPVPEHCQGSVAHGSPATAVRTAVRVAVQVDPVVELAWHAPEAVEAYPASEGEITIELTNRGNAPGLVELEATGSPRFQALGFPPPGPTGPGRPGEAPLPPYTTLILPPGGTRTVTLAFTTPAPAPYGLHRPLPVAVRVLAYPVHGGDGEPGAVLTGVVRTSVHLLPPPPGQIPRLGTPRIPATWQGQWQQRRPPSPRHGPSRASPVSGTYQLGALLPGAGGNRVRIAWRPQPSLPAPPSTPQHSAAHGVTLEELDYRHPGGWRLYHAPRADGFPPPLLQPSEALYLEAGPWRLGVPLGQRRGTAAGGEKIAGPAAALTLPLAPRLPATLSYRLGNGGVPAAAAARLAWRPAKEGHTGLQGSLGWAGAEGHHAWESRWRWSFAGPGPAGAGGGDSGLKAGPGAGPQKHTPVQWTGEVVARTLPPGFEGRPGETGVELHLRRLAGPAYLSLSVHSLLARPPRAPDLPPPVDTRIGAVRLHGGTRVPSGGGKAPLELELGAVHQRMRLHPLPPAAPFADTGALADELRLRLSRGGSGLRLTWASRWRTGSNPGWESRVGLRGRWGPQGWWFLSVGRYGEGRDGMWGHGWAAGVQIRWRTASGWQWGGWLDWPGPAGGTSTPVRWGIQVAAPSTGPWRWRLSAGGGNGLHWRIGVQHRFHLPWPFAAPPWGQLEGRITGPPGAGLAGAILELGGQRVSTGPGGEFRFPPLPPGTYLLHVLRLPPGLAGTALAPPPLEVEIRRGEASYATVALIPPGAVSGVIGPAGPAAASFRIELVDSGGKVIASRPSAAGGDFRFTGLAPGLYQLRVVALPTPGADDVLGGDHPRAERLYTVEVRAGATAHVEVTPPRPPEPRVTFSGELALP